MQQSCLQVQIAYLLRIIFDKLTARFNLIAHQNGENAVCFRSILKMNLDRKSVV